MLSKSVGHSRWLSFLLLLMLLLSDFHFMDQAPITNSKSGNSSKQGSTEYATLDHKLARKSTGSAVLHSNNEDQKASQPEVKILSVTERIQKYKYIPMVDREFKKKYPSIQVTATGYYAGPESTGKHPGEAEYGVTFSGVKVRRDAYSTIAADPRIFPLGTILYIPNYGYGVVADTGSAIKGYKIDLYFVTKSQVYQEWGKKKIKVFLIRKGKGKVTETMLDQLNRSISVSGPTKS